MQKTQILVICHHDQILHTILRLINNNDRWEAVGTAVDEQAVTLFHQQKFDLILLGSGITQEGENNLKKLFTDQNPQIKIIQHFGGGSGLLSNEIEAALADNPNGNFNVKDNPFK